MANGYRDLYLIEKQPNQTFLNVKTDDFGLQISTGNLSSFLIGSSGNFIRSGVCSSLIIGQGPNAVFPSNSSIIDAKNSRISGTADGAILGGSFHGILSNGFGEDGGNVIIGGRGNTINTSGGYYNSILGGQVNNIGGADFSLNTFFSFYTGAVRRSTIVGGYHNIIGPGAGNFINGGFYNIIGTDDNFRFNLSASNSTILNGCCNCVQSACYSSILNGRNNRVRGNNSSIVNGNYTLLSASGSVVIRDSSETVKSFTQSSTLFLDFASGINIETGNFRFRNQSLIKSNINSNSGTVFADSTKESVDNFSGPQTLTLDFASGIFIKNKTILQNSDIPSAENSAGTSGQFAFDDNYFYYCRKTNDWVRTALSKW
jgi:hypothetical protein